MKKKLLVFLMILMMCILSGCGMKEEEVKAYVEASLDAAYKGEFDAFVEITESTPEGAKAMYEENIVHIMEAAGFSDLELEDDLTEKYKELFLSLIKKVDYSVGEVEREENESFAVEVMVNPMTILSGIEDELTDNLLGRIDELEEFPSEDEIVHMSFEEMYSILSERVEEPEYSNESKVITIHLHKNEKGMYAIDEEDMLALDASLFVVE